MEEAISPIYISQDHPSLQLDGPAVERLVHAVLREENCSPRYIGIILTDHETVRHLNQEFLGRDYLTDVLSFNLGDQNDPADLIDGEIFVDLDTAMERAPEFETTFSEEACRYIVHGLLHLMGYDDATPDEKKLMHDLEDRYLRLLD